MSLLDTFLNNDTVRKMAFGQLKGLFQEKDLEFIIVALDGDGEVVLDMYAKGEAVITPLNREGVSKIEKGPVAVKSVLKALHGGKKGGKNG